MKNTEQQARQLQYLQNAANDLGLTIRQKYQEDDRRTVGKYFAEHDGISISPVLNYEQLNHFLLGWRRHKELITLK